jgi:hypothetical protein
MTVEEIIAKVKSNAEGRIRYDGVPAYEAELLVAEIDRLRKLANRLRVGLQIIAENPEWHDHSTRAADVLVREPREDPKP